MEPKDRSRKKFQTPEPAFLCRIRDIGKQGLCSLNPLADLQCGGPMAIPSRRFFFALSTRTG